MVREFAARRDLRAFVGYMALFFGLTELVGTYVQPVSLDLGVPVVGLGFLYAGFSLVSAGASYLADPIRNRVGIAPFLRVAPLLLAVAFVGVYPLPLLALPAFFGQQAVRSVTAVFRSQYLNDRIESIGRATLLSTASMAFAVTAAGSRQVGGVVADAIGPVPMLAIAGATFLAGVAVLRTTGPLVSTADAGEATANPRLPSEVADET